LLYIGSNQSLKVLVNSGRLDVDGGGLRLKMWICIWLISHDIEATLQNRKEIIKQLFEIYNLSKNIFFYAGIPLTFLIILKF